MRDFNTFRNTANAAFPSLVVSVMMYEKGSGRGGELVMYRLKVAGMAIGADITSQGDSPASVLAEVVRRVGIARRAVNAARTARELARRGIVPAVNEQVMVARIGQNKPQHGPEVPALNRAA